MNGLDALLALTEKFIDGEAIALHPERCLNARFRRINCTRCADACPTDAIRVIDGMPTLDNEACVHCGVCLHYCPTGAFSRPDVLPAKLVKTVAALPAGAIDLVCPHHPTPDYGPAPAAVQVKRCLSGLSPATMLELAIQNRDIWLDDTPCRECPLGATHPILQQTVDEASGWAALLKKARPVLLRSKTETLPPAQTRPVYDADRPRLSRRGLLATFKKMGKEIEASEEKIEMIRVGRNVPVIERLPQALPRQREKILNLLARLPNAQSPTSQPALPIADVTVDSARCTACGLCARFCPTAALKFISDGAEFALTLQPAACLGQACNICVPACPENALTTRPVAPSPAALHKKPLILGQLGQCEQCGEPIAVGPDLPATCFACRPRNPANLIASIF